MNEKNTTNEITFTLSRDMLFTYLEVLMFVFITLSIVALPFQGHRRGTFTFAEMFFTSYEGRNPTGGDPIDGTLRFLIYWGRTYNTPGVWPYIMGLSLILYFIWSILTIRSLIPSKKATALFSFKKLTFYPRGIALGLFFIIILCHMHGFTRRPPSGYWAILVSSFLGLVFHGLNSWKNSPIENKQSFTTFIKRFIGHVGHFAKGLFGFDMYRRPYFDEQSQNTDAPDNSGNGHQKHS